MGWNQQSALTRNGTVSLCFKRKACFVFFIKILNSTLSGEYECIALISSRCLYMSLKFHLDVQFSLLELIYKFWQKCLQCQQSFNNY